MNHHPPHHLIIKHMDSVSLPSLLCNIMMFACIIGMISALAAWNYHYDLFHLLFICLICGLALLVLNFFFVRVFRDE